MFTVLPLPFNCKEMKELISLVSFLIKRTLGAFLLVSHKSRSPSLSQSVKPMALPSSAKSKPLSPEMSANLPLPKLTKKQFLSFPLNDRPASIICVSCRCPISIDEPSLLSLPSSVLATTCRQKKLHKSPLSLFDVRYPLATIKSGNVSLLKSMKLDPHAQRPILTPAERLVS